MLILNVLRAWGGALVHDSSRFPDIFPFLSELDHHRGWVEVVSNRDHNNASLSSVLLFDFFSPQMDLVRVCTAFSASPLDFGY